MNSKVTDETMVLMIQSSRTAKINGLAMIVSPLVAAGTPSLEPALWREHQITSGERQESPAISEILSCEVEKPENELFDRA